MAKFSEPFLYTLTMTNRTGRDLALRESRLVYGIWRRDDIDGQGPVAVPAGATVQAMAIRMSSARPKGYECRCAWGDEAGAITLFVSVPFAGGRNRAGLDISGDFQVDGWTGVSTIGHQFAHHLTITCTR